MEDLLPKIPGTENGDDILTHHPLITSSNELVGNFPIGDDAVIDKPCVDGSYITNMITSTRRGSMDTESAFSSLSTIEKVIDIDKSSGILVEGEDTYTYDRESRDSIGFNVSGLNVTVIEMPEKSRGGGSDSGIESSHVFHRALSCNSGGYSSGGFDDLNKSCDSSLLSYSEETELMTQSLTIFGRDNTSEGGSDSDNKTKTPSSERSALLKKKAALELSKDSLSNSLKTSRTITPLSRNKNSVVSRRQNITPVKSPSIGFGTKTSPKRDKDENSKLSAGPHNKIRSVSNLEPRRHEHLNVSTKDGAFAKSSGPKPKIAAKPAVSMPRQKSLKTEYDGRWPSSAIRAPPIPHKARTPNGADAKKTVDYTPTRTNHLPDSKTITFDRYGTLPRRSRRRSPDAVKEAKVRSFSVNRDPSASRVYRNVRDVNKTLPPLPRRKPQRTRIYHETSVQTALTSSDIQKALEGVCFKEPQVDTKESRDHGIQVDRRQEAVEKLETDLKALREENAHLKENALRQEECLQSIEERLAEEKAAKDCANEELNKTELRLLVMLGKGKDADGGNSLQELETHLQSSGQVVIRQQKEIFNLQSVNRTVQRDLDKSVAAQKALLQQQQEVEAESTEMQEFLHAEKKILSEALRDSENEVTLLKECMAQKVIELERRQEECNHLVRISEQRRQENLTLQGRLNGLDARSKDLLLQQGAAVSGASVALSGLSSRLDGLVDQLVTSYDISERDLEDVIFHNEAYSKSDNSSAVASPEKTSTFHQPSPSPKRRASFLSAVVKAIRNATNQSPFSVKKSLTVETLQPEKEINGDGEDSEDATPVCSIENGEGISPKPYRLANSESLQNLSQAILNRQHFENGSGDLDYVVGDSDPASTEQNTVPSTHDFTFVDQIIEVDNLVTKLLKVLRIIQLENDTNVDELQDERVRLEEEVRREQDLKRASHEDVRSLELLVARVRGEVQEAKFQLQRKVEELDESRAELQAHREQVRSLTSDNWKLSAAQRKLQNCDEEVKGMLQKWKDTGDLPSPDSIEWILTARNEIPALQEQLTEKEKQLKEIGQKFSANKELLTQNLHQAANEIRRQYEAIDNALEILHSIQGVVLQCPPLAKLQRELEETNFQCASSQPIVSADLNANAALMSANEIHNGGIDAINNAGNTINGTAY